MSEPQTETRSRQSIGIIAGLTLLALGCLIGHRASVSEQRATTHRMRLDIVRLESQVGSLVDLVQLQYAELEEQRRNRASEVTQLAEAKQNHRAGLQSLADSLRRQTEIWQAEIDVYGRQRRTVTAETMTASIKRFTAARESLLQRQFAALERDSQLAGQVAVSDDALQNSGMDYQFLQPPSQVANVYFARTGRSDERLANPDDRSKSGRFAVLPEQPARRR